MLHFPLLLGLALGAAQAGPAASLNARLTGDLVPTHDPVIAREGNVYHVFSTGHGARLIETKSSKEPLDTTNADSAGEASRKSSWPAATARRSAPKASRRS